MIHVLVYHVAVDTQYCTFIIFAHFFMHVLELMQKLKYFTTMFR